MQIIQRITSTVVLLVITTAIIARQPKPAHTGRLFFTSQERPPNVFQQTDALQSLTLTNKSNLFITVFLQKPLGSYLQELAPTLSPDSLAKVGNYQFSFWVDNRLIYRTELLPGAPRPAEQQKDTSWSKPLIDNQHEGAWWSQSAWNRFMYRGGDSALSDGSHVLRIEFRPYVKIPALITGNIIAQGTLALTVKRKPEVDLAATKLSPVLPYGALNVSTEAFDRDRIKTMKAYIDADAFRHITSVVVLKKGKIVVEEYFNGSGRDSLHDVRSVGKSFASTLTGMAIRDGYLRSVQQKLGAFYNLKDYQYYTPAKANTSLKELLTMSSRFDGDDNDPSSPGNEENMYPTDNWVKFALDLPMDTVKYNGQWHYFTTGVMLLGSTLDKIIPRGLEKYNDAQLFKPLQITTYKWSYTPQGKANTAGGIRMKALDLAKYGQLYVDNGRWKGRQVIPEAWVKESLSKHKAITGRKDEYYGYLFWNKTYHSRDKAYETWYCTGNGGNKIYTFKDQSLVVVITATAYGNGYAHTQADRIIEEFILPAILQRQ